MPTITVNKQALHDYEVLEKLEAGIVLSGAEVKSVRNGNINLKGAYITLHNGEVTLTGAHIGAYKPAGPQKDYDPYRSRTLLLRKKEIARMIGKLKEKGLTAVPLNVYTSKSRLKIGVGIARGKRQFEKRELLKKRDVDREIRSRLKLGSRF
ncbi:SsrA-binding protein SmpB [Candidatus Uhrbacteria bacterium]|nr:SsrA-binding protein SmpB [Candidatus Uhrbacteria bacterium]